MKNNIFKNIHQTNIQIENPLIALNVTLVQIVPTVQIVIGVIIALIALIVKNVN